MKTKLSNKSLVEQLTDTLLNQIKREQLGPGDALPTAAALVRVHGVSRPVVREALKILEGRGVISLAAGRRAIVRPMNEDILTSFFERAVTLEEENIKPVLELYHGIEIQSAKLAAQRRTPEQVKELQALLTEMQSRIDNPDSFAELYIQFHLLVAEATHNTFLYYLISGISDALRNVMIGNLGLHMSLDERYLLHIEQKQIVAMIAAKNPEGVGRAMAFHFDEFDEFDEFVEAA